MCTNEPYDGPRIVHRSIVRQISQKHSIESDCAFVDDDDRHNSSGFQYLHSARIADSEPDITDADLYANSKNASSENLPRRSTFASSESSSTQDSDQHFNRQRLRCFSPHRDLPTSMPDPLTSTTLSHAQSVEIRSLPQLRETTTGDSGTGDSITLQLEPSVSVSQYEGVLVCGHPDFVLIANRYDFDPAKVAAYKKRTSKSTNLFSRLLNTFSSASTTETSCTPLVRHHSSTRTGNH